MTSGGTARDTVRPFVGRRAELQAIARLVDGATSGHGELLVITGPAGIGKSRLAEEIADHAAGSGALIAWGTCWADSGAPAFWPWHEVLAAIDPVGAEAIMAASSTEFFSRARAVVELLREASSRVPLVLVIDDAHDADPGTLGLARFAAKALRASPVLIVLTWRAASPGQDGVGPPSDAAIVELGPLADAEVADLVALLATGDTNRDTLAAEVAAVSAGNPLFVRHAVAELVGQATPTGGGTRRSRLLQRRLAALDDDVLDVLSVAAVIGPTSTALEVAAVGNIEVRAVDAAVAAGREAGLLADTVPLTFSHALVRDEFLARLDAATLRRLHASAARALARTSDTTPDHLSTIASHALAADGVLPLATIVDACRRAAQALSAAGATARAESYYAKAVDLYGRPDAPEVPTELLVDHAEAVLRRGRLADARPRFWLAARSADLHDQPDLLGRAALGLGGVWVHEHRTADESHAYLGLLERATENTLDPERSLELTVRLAAERLFTSDDERLVMADAIDALRARGPHGALARSLSLFHHTVLGPASARDRLEVAHEILATASRAGDTLTAMMGTMWLAVDSFLLGDPSAVRWHDELRMRSEALDLPALGFIAEALDVMLLLRAGRFAEAEELAGRCATTGAAAGDADATNYFGGHILCSRWTQGVGEDLIPALEDLRRGLPLQGGTELYTAAQATLTAAAGRLDEAKAIVASMYETGPLPGRAGVPRQTSLAMLTAFCRIEAAEAVGDARLAAEQAQWIAPYANLPVMASLAIACFGVAERSVGLAARAQGDLDSAMLHLSRAVEGCKRLGNLPMAAVNLADWAETATRNNDRARARALWSEAIDAGAAYGLDARLPAWNARREELRVASSSTSTGVLRRHGDTWEISAAAKRITVAHGVGFDYLAQLVERTGAMVTVTEMTGAPAELSPQDLVDPESLARYRRRIREIEEDIAEAERHADLERISLARGELDQLLGVLHRELRPDGRSRRFSGPQERARSSVQKALRRAIDRIGAADEDLGEAFRAAVLTGSECSFSPAAPLPDRWNVYR